ncbi:MAG: toprim domain-containing protein [Christensenellales bacterium]
MALQLWRKGRSGRQGARSGAPCQEKSPRAEKTGYRAAGRQAFRCTGRNAAQNELFIVEGDCAGGSAKQGRNRRFQAILPLRGKPLNVEKKRWSRCWQNDEFRSIITALGTGIGEDFNISGLKYDEIIILSDADQDGAHIRAILLTFFYRYMKALITEGHVYMGQPPLYSCKRAQTCSIFTMMRR